MVVLQQWNHYAVVFDDDAKQIRIYYNGNFLYSDSVSYSPMIDTVTRRNCLIGKSHLSGDGLFNGYIDTLNLYLRVLTVSEINALYSLSTS